MMLPGAPSKRDITPRKQARWIAHSPQAPPSSSFRDIHLHEMLKSMVLPNNMTDYTPV